MSCVIKCIARGNQARVKNTDLRHPSCTFVMLRRKSASPVHNVLKLDNSLSRSYLWSKTAHFPRLFKCLV